jgi:hypothetical protein
MYAWFGTKTSGWLKLTNDCVTANAWGMFDSFLIELPVIIFKGRRRDRRKRTNTLFEIRN